MQNKNKEEACSACGQTTISPSYNLVLLISGSFLQTRSPTVLFWRQGNGGQKVKLVTEGPLWLPSIVVLAFSELLTLHSLVDNTLHNFQLLEPTYSGLLKIPDSCLLVSLRKCSHWVLVQVVIYRCHVWLTCKTCHLRFAVNTLQTQTPSS